MAKPVTFSREALTTLKRIDRTTAARILKKIGQLAGEPASLASNVQSLKGGEKQEGPLLRLRVGDWRVIYRNGILLAVIRIAPRGSAYD